MSFTVGNVATSNVRTTQDGPIWISGLCLACVALLAELDVNAMVLVAIAGLGALAVRRALSALVVVYVLLIAIELLVAARLPWGNVTVTVGPVDTYAALWIAVAVFAGTLSCAWPPRRTRVVPHGNPSFVPALAISAGALAVHLILITSGATGVAAQLAGRTSGGGYLGLFGQTGAAIAGGVVLAAHATGRGRSATGIAAALLVVLHAVTLAFTGFRSAGPLLLCAIVLARVTGSSRRRRAKQAAVILALSAGGIGLFLAGSAIRTDITAQAGPRSGGGPPSVELSNLVDVVTARIDYREYLARAIELRDDSSAREAVNLRDQFGAAVPRVLNPNKPSVDYGARISQAYFGISTNIRTSSLITSFGDGIVNFGVTGTVLAIGLYVIGLDRIYRTLGEAPTAGRLALRIITVSVVIDIAPSVVMSAIEIARDSIFTGTTLLIATWLTRIYGRKNTQQVAIYRPLVQL
ncbi:hypothetical protein [Frankia sp. Cj5]|nr:hypothetical protein [Frankia sp. Cj5]